MRAWKGDEEVGLWGGGVCVCVSVCMEWGVRVWKGDEEVDLWGGGYHSTCHEHEAVHNAHLGFPASDGHGLTS